MKFTAYLIIPLVLISLYGGCGSDGHNISEEDQIVLDNLCFLLTSDDPCFNPNEGGETTFVNNMSVDDFISEQESNPDFVAQLEFTEIFRAFRRSFFLPTVREGCRWDDSGLVIKNNTDWDNYRNNCFFTDNFFELPDIDFVNSMVLVSLKGGQSFGTEIVAVLELENEIVAVISDRVSDVLSSESGPFGSSAIEVETKNLPVSFVRVEDICNSFFNFSNSECLADSMLNVCEVLFCSSANYRASPGSCTFINCDSFHCNSVRTIDQSMVVITQGIFNNLALDEFDFPIGIVEVEGVQEEFSCSLIVE